MIIFTYKIPRYLKLEERFCALKSNFALSRKLLCFLRFGQLRFGLLRFGQLSSEQLRFGQFFIMFVQVYYRTHYFNFDIRALRQLRSRLLGIGLLRIGQLRFELLRFGLLILGELRLGLLNLIIK